LPPADPARRPAAESDDTEQVVDAALLRSFPLPQVNGDAPKAVRGTALIVGGSAETPGGVLLAAHAAYRVGAGKVQIATVESVASALAVAMPEARVVALPETVDGAIDHTGIRKLAPLLDRADAVLIGTSTLDADATGALTEALVPCIGEAATVVLDAGALPGLRDEPQRVRPIAQRTTIIPNPSEMARLLSTSEDDVCKAPRAALDDAVDLLGTVVALRDSVTRTAARGRGYFVDDSGHPALGTAGSGDVLAGALVGLAARGADPLCATLWAVHLHGLAGEQLGRHGPGIGTLARELVDALPAALQAIAGRPTG
jgi:ADP-dependent NAD(P)H-hydrate dehydratase